ncbi:thiolase family protein [Streptomyces sp. NPDC046887]|uniref:thiolase family protein n=1 Tax=Streptomyces sp. NPDC046887 TaxID=3155472 RepID=UPI0033E5D746
MSPHAVYVVDAVRTPIGRYNGALAAVRPDDLAAHTLRALLERTPELDPARIGDVVLGNANGAGYVLPKSERPFPAGHTELYSTTLGWRMVNPRMDPQWTVPLGESAELIAEKHAIGRERQDAFALASHLKAAGARDAGLFDGEIAPVTVPARRGEPTVVDRDESIRANTSPEALAALKPAFRTEGGTVTAGNSSPLNDGAAALLLADEDGLRATGREPLARITAHAVSACEPHYFGLAPVQAVHRALERAGRAFADLATLELNEAFAAQVLGCLAEWPELDPAVLNPRGGAIALGHPLGASGARLAGAVAHQLAARGSGTGVAALCIGVGQGSALVLER